MEKKSLYIPELFRSAWQLMQEHLSFIIGLTVTYLVLAQIPSILYEYYYQANGDLESFDISQIFFNDNEKTSTQVVIEVLLQVLKWVLDLGYVYVCLRIVDKEQTEVSDLFNQWGKVFSYVVATILYSLSVILGLVLLILPGIYFGIRLQFYSYLILDKNLNPFEALSESYNLTKDLSLDLFLLAVVYLFMLFAGILAFIIGIIPVIGLIALCNAIIYRSLLANSPQIPSSEFR